MLSTDKVPLEVLRVALPVGIGLASAALLALQISSHYKAPVGTPVPKASIRKGDITHDKEHDEDANAFMLRCYKECGPIFELKILQMDRLTVVSGPMVREIFMTEQLSFSEAMEDATGVRKFTNTLIKSNSEMDSMLVHNLIRTHISPNLNLLAPRIEYQLNRVLDKRIGGGKRVAVDEPLHVFQEMIATAMADVFMGHEMAAKSEVIETFRTVAIDFGKVLFENMRQRSFLQSLFHDLKHRYTRPLQHHLDVLVHAVTPIVLERRRQEAEAVSQGREYEAPLDILQRSLEHFDKYGFLDLEDICGHMLNLVLASVHTTADTSAVLPFFLAEHPSVHDELFEEQNQVLDQQQQEREEMRQRQMADTVTEEYKSLTSIASFKGTELDPAKDRELTHSTLRKMVKMDSFARETFRWRIEAMSLIHKARSDTVLSNGMVIRKGDKVAANVNSIHQVEEMQCGEDVKAFRPWRFVGKAKACTKASVDNMTWGMGTHACPGRFIAVMEVKTILSLIVRKYSRIEIQDKSKTTQVLTSRIGIGAPVTGLYFTSRDLDTTPTPVAAHAAAV